MLFHELPQQQWFYFNQQLYYKICPVYKTCCQIQYNAKNESVYLLLEDTIEITPVDSNVQPIPVKKSVFSISNLFLKGGKMLLRQVPVGVKFLNNDKIYRRFNNGDKVQTEEGEIIVMNKNTMVQLLGDIEEDELEDLIEDVLDDEFEAELSDVEQTIEFDTTQLSFPKV